MNTALRVGLISLISLVAGCASQPTVQELASADYGPTPRNYQGTVTTYMQSILKDPESARYGFYIEPVKGYAGRNRIYGWATCVMVNAKNSFGGYTGAKQYFFLIKNDLVAFHDATDGRSVFSDIALDKSCESLRRQ